MLRVMTRKELTDAQWERIRPLLPKRVGRRGRPHKDHRLMWEALLWITRTGAPGGICRSGTVPGRRSIAASVSGNGRASWIDSWQAFRKALTRKAGWAGSYIMSMAPWSGHTSMRLAEKRGPRRKSLWFKSWRVFCQGSHPLRQSWSSDGSALDPGPTARVRVVRGSHGTGAGPTPRAWAASPASETHSGRQGL